MPTRSPGMQDASHPPTDQPSPQPVAPEIRPDAVPSAAPEKVKNPPPLDPKNMDTSVDPGKNFFLYANGAWLKNNPIPPEYSRWGSFNELIEKNNDALHQIAEKAANETAQTAGQSAPAKTGDQDLRTVGDFYASGMNQEEIEKTGTQPLQEELQRIEGIKTKEDLAKEIGHLHSIGVTGLFGFYSDQDDKNSVMVIAQASQGGLGLPDRDYYTKEDAASKKLRAQYLDHVAKMFTLLGDSPDAAATQAKTVMEIETSLAKPARTRVQLRDPHKNYNSMTTAQWQQLMPDFNLHDYFSALNIAAPAAVNVRQPEFFKALNKALADVPVNDWKTYLRWHLIHDAAPSLTKAFVDENFSFYGKALSGAEQIKPRWKRVVEKTDEEIGEALGKLYVADYFPPKAKARALEMVNNLKEALGQRIKDLDWMDEATKQQALKKLAAFNVKIGYPEKWRDYSLLKIDRGPYLLNVMRSDRFEVARELNKIGKPVDRTEWHMTPPTVNAYYNSHLNEIVFPAGILQPPFFDPDADDAVNYGGMGAVIGHEMTHGFDDRGRQYDAVGNLRDWWSEESARKFTERAKKVIEQYSSYAPLPGQHLNGELTQGENIADIGGLKIAYMALQKVLGQHPEEATKKIDGFTPEQRFFLAYAQVWRANQRDAETRRRLVIDPHSPPQYRCNGPLSNMPEFAKAFNLPKDSPMVRPPDQRVNIW